MYTQKTPQDLIEICYRQGQVQMPKYPIVVDMFPMRKSHDVIIKVKIQGKFYKFIFDTGCFMSTLNPQIIEKIKNTKKGKINITDSYDKTEEKEMFSIPEIEIGSIKINDVCMVGITPIDIFLCDSIDGIIGVNIINKLNWFIDYDHKILTIGSNNFELEAYKSRFKFFTISHIPHINLDIFGKTHMMCMIDFGASYSLIMPKNSNDSIQNLISKGKCKSYSNRSWGIFGLGDVDTINEIIIDKLKIENIEYKSSQIDVINRSNKSNKLILGNDFMRKFNIGINNKTNYIYLFERNHNHENENEIKPISIDLIDDKFMISSLLYCSKADSMGLRIDDEIGIVNNKKTTDFLDRCSFNQWFVLQTKLDLIMKNGKAIHLDLEEHKYLENCN